jgi:TolB protein
MMIRSLIKIGFACGTVFAIVAVGSIGCQNAAQPESTVAVVEQAPPSPPEPTLSAAGDAQLTLFGEFPDRQRVPFHTQAAAPMKQHTFESDGADFDVEASPDGRTLVFASTRHDPQPNLYLKTVDGRAVTQLTDDPAADVQPAFSPDGQTIAFASSRSGNWDIWLIGLQGGRATQVTHSAQHEVHPSFSPDGKQLVYCQFNDRTAAWELWVLSLAHPESRKMIGLGLFPDWSPKADSIVYQRARERGGRWFSIWRIDLDKGEPKFPIELAASTEMALIRPSWSPDGEWITYGTAQVADRPEADPARLEASPAGKSQPTVERPAAGRRHVAPAREPEPAEAIRSTMNRGDIWMMRADGSSATRLTDGTSVAFGSVWGVDERVYFTAMQNGSENIWSVQPMVRPAGRLTEAPAESAPVIPAAGVIQPAGGEPVQANRGG